jgi:hypothetical protein
MSHGKSPISQQSGAQKAVDHSPPSLDSVCTLCIARLSYGSVTEEELNLFEFSTGFVTKARASSSQIMACKGVDSGFSCTFLDYIPNNILADSASPHLAVLADRSEEFSSLNRHALNPCINRALDPFGNGNGSHVTSFTDKVNDGPAVFASLKVTGPKCRDL